MRACPDPVPFVSVIGRGGEQISRIQAESGCKIQIASGKGFFFFIYLSLIEISILQSFPDLVPLLVAWKFRGLGKYM